MFHTEYNNYFEGSYEQITNGSYTKNGNAYLYNSFFKDLSNRVLYSSGDLKTVIESTTFISISTNEGYGGCIFLNENGEIVQNRVCSTDCWADSDGQHCYCITSIGDSKNWILESSFSRTFNEEKGDISISFYHGHQFLYNSNISYFKTSSISAYFFCTADTESNSSMNSIINNTSSGDICICFSTDTYQQPHDEKLFRSNIINNKASDELIQVYQNTLTINNCNIINNCAENLFIIQSLFDYEVRGSISIENSCLNNNQGTIPNNISIISTKNEMNSSTTLCFEGNAENIFTNIIGEADEIEIINKKERDFRKFWTFVFLNISI